MSFKTNKYKVIEKAIEPSVADFIYEYFLLKRKVATTFFSSKYISPFSKEWGVWNDKQVPETYSHYGDIAMETLLQSLLSLMEKETELNLSPTYSYARIYKKGDILKRHKDRPACEISTTLHLGGEEWPIHLEPSGDKGREGISLQLNPGDMLIYSGCDLEHWREAFEGDNCGQVFLHYNDIDGKFKDTNQYDGRPHLGLPTYFKKNFNYLED